MRTVESPREVGVYDTMPIFEGEIGGRFEDSDAGVVDEDVERAEGFVDEAEQLRHLLTIRHIGSLADDFTFCLRRNFVYRTVYIVLLTAADCDGSADFCQTFGDCQPNATCTAGYNGAALFEKPSVHKNRIGWGGYTRRGIACLRVPAVSFYRFHIFIRPPSTVVPMLPLKNVAPLLCRPAV